MQCTRSHQSLFVERDISLLFLIRIAHSCEQQLQYARLNRCFVIRQENPQLRLDRMSHGKNVSP